MLLPQTLLAGAAWDFKRSRYTRLEGFRKVVEQVQAEVHGVNGHWNLDATAIPQQHIRVRYYGHHSRSNEAIIATLRSEKPEGFTNIELLYRLHELVHREHANGKSACLHGLEFQAAETELQPLLPPLYTLCTYGDLSTRDECLTCVMARALQVSNPSQHPDWRPEETIAEDFYAA
jgi:hypothetical protein